MANRRCAYCGVQVRGRERDHLIPRCLYPASLAGSKVQRITVPVCRLCNRGWSDDEAHFRNVILVAGAPNAPVTELWETKAVPSFSEVDGPRRAEDLLRQITRLNEGAAGLAAIYPAQDERVMRIVSGSE